MKIAVMCRSCKTPHLDHYACDKCGARVSNFKVQIPNPSPEAGESIWIKVTSLYCPNCREPYQNKKYPHGATAFCSGRNNNETSELS